MAWNAPLATLVTTGKMGDDSVDLAPLVAGVLTVLRQFDDSALRTYLEHLAQCARAQAHVSAAGGSSSKASESIVDLGTLLTFIESFCSYAAVPAPWDVEEMLQVAGGL